MKAKRISLVVIAALLAVCNFLFVSCEEKIDISSVQGMGTGGSFLVSNISTNEDIQIEGAITINIGEGTKELNAKNGDVIRIKFKPKEEYAKYEFNTVFKLYDGTEIKNPNNYEYVFTLSNVEVKDYPITLIAKYDKDGVQLYAGGGFTLRVKD